MARDEPRHGRFVDVISMLRRFARTAKKSRTER
jgi:hypothetical protein